MLVLSRQRDEVIEIGGGFSVGGIDVTVVDIRGDKVRLGIDAPKGVSVHRREVADAVRRGDRGEWTERPAGACSMVPVTGTVNAKPAGSVPGDAGTPNRQGAILP